MTITRTQIPREYIREVMQRNGYTLNRLASKLKSRRRDGNVSTSALSMWLNYACESRRLERAFTKVAARLLARELYRRSRDPIERRLAREILRRPELILSLASRRAHATAESVLSAGPPGFSMQVQVMAVEIIRRHEREQIRRRKFGHIKRKP